MPTRDIRVFLSHSSSDTILNKNGTEVQLVEYAKSLLERELLLEAVIRENITKGESLRKSILDMISRCDYQIVLVTPAMMNSHWAIFEFGAGLAGLGSKLMGFPSGKRRERVLTLTEETSFQQSQEKGKEIFEGLSHIFWKHGVGSIRIQNLKKSSSSWEFTLLGGENVLSRLRSMLLLDTFTGMNGSALGHLINKPECEVSWKEYVKWLEVFNAWTESHIFAVSREPLKYWLSDARRYRERIQRNIEKGLRVKRLSLWSSENDIIPSYVSDDAQKDLWRSVGRTGEPRYECSLCITYDLLWLFLIQCHNPIDDAYYAFMQVLKGYSWISEFKECLVYEGQYVLTANFPERGKDVVYTLSHIGPIVQAMECTERIDDIIKKGESDLYNRSVTKHKWVFPALGRIDALIDCLEQYHNSSGCPNTLKRPKNM